MFARNLDVSLDRFEVVLESATVNENPEMDTLIPISKQLRTNHLILRGEYEKISLAIYGKLVSPEETSLMLNRQFEISQPMKREDNISPLLSNEEEEMLIQAEKSFADLEITTFESMTDLKLVNEITSLETGLLDKLNTQAEALVTSLSKDPDPSMHCIELREFIENIETVYS